MKVETIIQLYGKAIEAMVFQGPRKVQFLVFFVFGLVCCFAGYCGVALVSWFQ